MLTFLINHILGLPFYLIPSSVFAPIKQFPRNMIQRIKHQELNQHGFGQNELKIRFNWQTFRNSILSNDIVILIGLYNIIKAKIV